MTDQNFQDEEDRQQYAAWRARYQDPEAAARGAWIAAKHGWAIAQSLQADFARAKRVETACLDWQEKTADMTRQPEALRLARKFEEVGFVGDHKFAQDRWCREAAVELRRQHARIAELEDVADMAIKRIAEQEAQLAAIGAGGVEPLRKRASHGVHTDVAIPISPSDAGFPASGSAAPVAHADSRDVER